MDKRLKMLMFGMIFIFLSMSFINSQNYSGRFAYNNLDLLDGNYTYYNNYTIIEKIYNQINESELNVNSSNYSDYWDNLDDPSDIFFHELMWSFADNWNYIEENQFHFNESKLSTTYYNATSVNAVYGSYTGTVEETQHPNGDYDGVNLNVTESAGSPGLDFRINFTNGITRFNRGYIRYKTGSIKGDLPSAQLWDYTNSMWTDFPQLVETNTYRAVEIPVHDDSRFVQNGTVRVRIYKSENGNTNNQYNIDWLAISKGYGTPSGQEVDPFFKSWRDNPYLENSLNMTGNNITEVERITSNFSHIRDYIDFDEKLTSPNPPTDELRCYAFDESGKSRLRCVNSDGIEITLGRDAINVIRNGEDVPIDLGDAVYLNGSTGEVGNVYLAIANNSLKKAEGVMIEDCSSGDFCYMADNYKLKGFDLSAYSEGDELWLSPNEYGGYVVGRPDHPYVAQSMGIVSKNTPSGIMNIDVKTANHFSEGTLSNIFEIGDMTSVDKKLCLYDGTDHCLTWDGSVFNFNNTLQVLGNTVLDTSTSFGGEVSGSYNSITLSDSALDDNYIELGDSFGGEVSGTYDSITLDNDALDDQYYDSESDLTGLLNDNYVDESGDTMTGDLTVNGQIIAAGNNQGTSGSYPATSQAIRFGEGRGINYNSADDRIFFAMNENVPMVIDNGGNVGIGTTTPNYKLDVNGSVQLSNDNTLIWKDSGGISRRVLEMTSSDIVEMYNPAGDIAFYPSNSEEMRITSTGLGIGTTSPEDNLHIQETDNPGLLFQDYVDSNGDVWGGIDFHRYGSNYYLGNLSFKLSSSQTGSNSDDSVTAMSINGFGETFFHHLPGGDADVYVGSKNYREAGNVYARVFKGLDFYSMNDDGTVGTGIFEWGLKLERMTEDPTSQSVSNGSIWYRDDLDELRVKKGGEIKNILTNVDDIWVDESGDTMTGGLGIGYSQPSGTDLHVDGNVGIGTTSPSAKLEVGGDLQVNDNGFVGSGGGDAVMQGEGYFQSNSGYAGNGFVATPWVYARAIEGDERGSGSTMITIGNASAPNLGLDKDDHIGFVTQGSNRMVLDSGGRLGIGTQSPSAKLDVNGDFKFSGEGKSDIQFDYTSIAEEPFYFGYLSTTQTNVEGGTYVNVWENTDGVFTTSNMFDVSNSELSISTGGYYKFDYNVQVHRTGSDARGIMESYLEVNGNPKQDQSATSCYIRNSVNGDECTMSGTAVLNLNDGDSVKLYVHEKRGGETGNNVEHARMKVSRIT